MAENIILRDVISLVSIIFVTLSYCFAEYLQYFNSLIIAAGLLYLAGCLFMYLIFCKGNFLFSKFYSYFLLLTAIILSGYRILFGSVIFHFQIPLFQFFMYTYFVVMHNSRHDETVFAQSIFLILLFSIVLSICYEVTSLTFFAYFVLIYSLFNMPRYFLKTIIVLFLTLAIHLLVILRNSQTTLVVVDQIRAMAAARDIFFSSQTFAGFVKFYDILGPIGTIFGFLVLMLLIVSYVHNAPNLTFFVFVISILLLIVLLSLRDIYDYFFNSPFLIAIYVLFLVYMRDSIKVGMSDNE